MESFWTFITADFAQHPIVLSLVVVMVVQLRDLKKDVKALFRYYDEHLKNHAKGDV